MRALGLVELKRTGQRFEHELGDYGDAPGRPGSVTAVTALFEDLVDHGVVVPARWSHLAQQPLDDLVGPLVRLQQQIAQHGDAQVALGFGAGAADAGVAQHLRDRLVFLAEPRLGELLAREQPAAGMARAQDPGLDEAGELRVAPFVGEADA